MMAELETNWFGLLCELAFEALEGTKPIWTEGQELPRGSPGQETRAARRQETRMEPSLGQRWPRGPPRS